MKRLSFLILILTIGLSSCQLQKLTVNVQTPSRVYYPPEIRSMMITSRYVPATGVYEDIQWGSYETVDSMKWSLSESIVDTLARYLAEDNRYLVKARHYPRMLRHNGPDLPEQLPWEGMQSLAEKELVQAILVIEGFDISRTEITMQQEEDTYSAGFAVQVSVALRVYEPDKRRLLDDSIYLFRNEYQSTGPTAQAARSGLAAEFLAEKDICRQAARKYADLVTPGHKTESRYFYAKGDSLMEVAGRAALTGEWGKAESKWKWMAYNSKDTIIQAKASFNMALACERDGRLNQAVGFARRSQRLRPEKRTLDYIGILEEKIQANDESFKNGIIIKRW